jgi:hypothetical protein
MPNPTSGIETLPAGVVRADEMPPEELERMCRERLAPTYPHDAVYGDYCFLADHVAAPYERVFDYCADVRALAEWTLNIRRLEPVGAGLYRGAMVFSPEDAARPATDIYIRADAWKGPEHGLVCYPCSWDEPGELWMRYYFLLADATRTLGAPGTVVMWTNCRHRYYDRGAHPVPAFVEAGRARTDRFWAGDGWPLFAALHRIELDNLKRVVEARWGGAGR